MKKILALTLALIMILGLATTAFAAEEGEEEQEKTYSITINNKLDGHIYEAYQIFTGDLSKDATNDAGSGTTAILSNVIWGDGVNVPAEGIAIGETKTTDAAVVAEALAKGDLTLDALLSQLTLTEAKVTSTDEGDTYVIDGLEPGYYLVKDQDDSLDEDHDAYTAYIIEVLENSTVNPKNSIPEVDKQVHDEDDDAEEGHKDGWGETADHAMNETFQFKLIATLPADVDFAAYETYQIVFKDKMSKGITFENIESVKINGVDVNQYTLSDNAKAPLKGAAEWSLTIADVKTATGTTIDLTKGAVVEVIYKAHLNEEAVVGEIDDNENTVYLEYSNNPNAEGENDFGKTPEDTVWVFTYKMDNNKVDGNGQPLTGAGFKLYSDAGCTTEIPVIFDSTLNAYRLTKTGETGEEMSSAGTNAVFNIVGLDVGTYYLKETTTPAGYNTCPVVTVEIDATHKETSKTTATTKIVMTQDGTETTANRIVNKSGTVLPETGGIGTTIFYIVGGMLAVAAVVLLVTKKRMAVAE